MRCDTCGKEVAEGTAVCPYCGGKLLPGAPGEDRPLYQCEVKGLLKSGQLLVYRDRTEFVFSRVQKMVLPYASLVSLKKGLDRINFLMEDGRTESCSVSRKNLHEAYYSIEQASRPFLAQRRERLLAQGIRYSFPSSPSGLGGVLGGGVLNLLEDRAEYLSPAGKSDTLFYRDMRSARVSPAGALELSFHDGSKRAFTVEKELREELGSFLSEALRPFLEERKAALLVQGIYFSMLSGQGFGKGTLNVYADRLVYTAEAGQSETVAFREIRSFAVSGGSLTADLTNASTKTYTVDKEVQDELRAFLESAVAPYIKERTEGYTLSFGMNERLEINEERGLFHVLRQGGREISEAYPLDSLVKAEAVETKASRDLVSSLFSFNGEAPGQSREELIADLGVLLTVRAGQGEEQLPVCFGNMTSGAGRKSPAYIRCAAERERFFAYLAERIPACEQILPPPPAEAEPSADSAPQPAASPAVESAETESAPAPAAAGADGAFRALLTGISRFTENCAAPMTIAIQGDWETGSGSFLRMVYRRLEESGQGKVLWLGTWQFSQYDLGDQLPVLLADRLIELLGGGVSEEAKSRAKMLAQGMIGIASGLISQGTSDGQKLTEALFRDNPAGSLEQKRRLFSELAARRAGGGKLILFMDDLNRLAPARLVGLLEALRSFFDTPGCVFIASVERERVLQGQRELNGPDYSEAAGNAYFDRLFKTVFRVPKGSLDVGQYVRDNLGRLGLSHVDEDELRRYGDLAALSVGGDPKALDRLFNSLLLLKSLAGEELFALRAGRVSLFALVCMQSRFPAAYRCLLQEQDRPVPNLLASLDSASGEDDGGQALRAFMGALRASLDAEGDGRLPDDACGAFAKALSVSAFTAFN